MRRCSIATGLCVLALLIVALPSLAAPAKTSAGRGCILSVLSGGRDFPSRPVVHGRPARLRGLGNAGLGLASGAYLEVPASEGFQGLRALSFAGWFRPTRLQPDWPVLIGRWDHPDRRSFILYVSNRGLVEFGVGWSAAEYYILREGFALPQGAWTHVAATWDGASGTMRIYRNGQLAKEDHCTPGRSLIDSDVPVLIGAHNNTPGGAGTFVGGLSRVRAWDRAIGAEEVGAMYDSERQEYPEMAPETDSRPQRLDAGSAKQLLFDDGILAETKGVRITMNRPERRGGPCVVVDKPWEKVLNCFGVTVLQEGDLCRMYYPAWDSRTSWDAQRLLMCYATSLDGNPWEKPELDIIPFEGAAGTNILYPAEEQQRQPGYFFGTCVFRDTNPKCRPDERYKMINGDSDTCVWSSPDGLHFRRMFDKPSFRPADTNNVMFFDDRIGRYVAYVRSFAPLRVVGRCEFDDLSDFGQDSVVLACDEQDQAALDKGRFADVSFYNSSAIKYPYAENAYIAFPSAFYHYPEPPASRLPNDGISDIHLAVSRDGVSWSRPSREAFMPLQEGELGLYMAYGIARRGDELDLYYGIYYNSHGDVTNPDDHIARARIRLDGFASADAEGEGVLTTIPLTFSGDHLELNVAGEEVRAALLDESGEPVPGYGLTDCDPLSGDHIAGTVTWHGQSSLRSLAGRTLRLRIAMRQAKLYAFQFAA